MYDRSMPDEQDLFEVSYVNHVAWGTAIMLLLVCLWLGVALVNAENQRHAVVAGQCQDPVFQGQIDKKCLQVVHSRAHWWEHLWYGMTHLTPEDPTLPPVPRKVSR
jgi:hypothetical protein